MESDEEHEWTAIASLSFDMPAGSTVTVCELEACVWGVAFLAAVLFAGAFLAGAFLAVAVRWVAMVNLQKFSGSKLKHRSAQRQSMVVKIRRKIRMFCLIFG